ncbi:conserved Plasmodium protein, unknown function [Plasmodium malariae]|uniref:Uncharacterized protein n=1 Tax=Plasmodium malariae TaxID=5858 RepID=A0A1C3KBP0_PLAMA|nr:conserved Plasmodium protein, unknown function [Plasmodium malariae]
MSVHTHAHIHIYTHVWFIPCEHAPFILFYTVSMDSMREPLVVIKIPSLNFYDLIEIQHDVGNLISVNNEELFY